MSTYSGRCYCGAITWQSDADVLWAGHCHCESCRRAAPADFVSWIGFPWAEVDWSGESMKIRQTSPGVERGHCATCGTSMYYRNVRWPTEIHLHAATLNDPTLYQPKAHYHWDERLPWTVASDDLPRYVGEGDLAD